jgi:hypothetical protein
VFKEQVVCYVVDLFSIDERRIVFSLGKLRAFNIVYKNGIFILFFSQKNSYLIIINSRSPIKKMLFM